VRNRARWHKEVATMSERFDELAGKAASLAGNYISFLLAFAVVVVWAVSGPLFGFSETWQLVINTGTTIVTFLMVFLIQNTQNRDSMALHLKIDELIRVLEKADNTLIEAEDDTEKQLHQLKEKYRKLAESVPEDVAGQLRRDLGDEADLVASDG
jgi:low affinity Fe/Cu permease